MTPPSPIEDALKAIEARLKALIPNPWNWRWVLPGQSEIEIVGMRDGDESNEWESLLQMFVNNGAKKQAMANADFICKSKADIAYLLSAVRRYQAQEKADVARMDAATRVIAHMASKLSYVREALPRVQSAVESGGANVFLTEATVILSDLIAALAAVREAKETGK